MNKKMFFSYLLSVSVCSFSLQATVTPITEQSIIPNIHSEVEELVLPVLLQCVVDEHGNVVKIINFKHLGKEAIAEFYSYYSHQDIVETDPVSLHRSLTLVLFGTKDLVHGLATGLVVGFRGAIAGTQYLYPHVISFTKNAVSFLNEKYQEYLVQQDEDALRDEERQILLDQMDLD